MRKTGAVISPVLFVVSLLLWILAHFGVFYTTTSQSQPVGYHVWTVDGCLAFEKERIDSMGESCWQLFPGNRGRGNWYYYGWRGGYMKYELVGRVSKWVPCWGSYRGRVVMPGYFFCWLPLYIPVFAFALPTYFVSLPQYRRHRRLKVGLCMRCGYDLRASKDRCPECGVRFEKPKLDLDR